jgi:hypothetical protein
MTSLFEVTTEDDATDKNDIPRAKRSIRTNKAITIPLPRLDFLIKLIIIVSPISSLKDSEVSKGYANINLLL